jgi:hypothetical protein
MKSNNGRKGTVPVILNLCTNMEVSGQLHALATYHPRKELLVPNEKAVAWAQSQSGGSQENKTFDSARYQTPDLTAH